MRKVLENRAVLDEERMKKLEEELKEARTQAEEADKEQKRQTINTHIWNSSDLALEITAFLTNCIFITLFNVLLIKHIYCNSRQLMSFGYILFLINCQERSSHAGT